MKFWIIVIFIGVLAFVLLFPPVHRQLQCYEASKNNLDNIAAYVLNQRLTKDMECDQATTVLFDLETCIQDSTKSATFATYTNDTILRMVAILRPYGNNLWTLKADHNLLCTQSSRYQLP